MNNKFVDRKKTVAARCRRGLRFGTLATMVSLVAALTVAGSASGQAVKGGADGLHQNAAKMASVPAKRMSGTGRVIADPCLNQRTSASKTANVVQCIPKGVVLTVSCVVTGDAMTGPYGTTTIWDRVSYNGKAGYVTDAYLYTGTSGAVAGKCATSTTEKARRALAWANAQIGATGWNGWCERFVEVAYGTSGRYASAYAHYLAVKSKVSTAGTPQPGPSCSMVPPQ